MAVEMTILMSAQNAIATESVATYAYFMRARGQFDDTNIAWPASCPQAGREPEAGDGAPNRRRSVPGPAASGAGPARTRMTWLFTASRTTSAPWMRSLRSLLSRATCVPRWGCTTARCSRTIAWISAPVLIAVATQVVHAICPAKSLPQLRPVSAPRHSCKAASW